MKKIFLIISLSLFLAGCVARIQTPSAGEGDLEVLKEDNMAEIVSKLEITSPAFEPGGMIPAKYTCDGEGVNPLLRIVSAPEGTESLVLICDDPDAPNGDWVHWLVWNIEPTITEIAENSAPEFGVEGMTSFGKTGYGGPCPPSGTHRYFFKLYALDARLELDASADKAKLLEAMEGHVLGEAQLMGMYSRKP